MQEFAKKFYNDDTTYKRELPNKTCLIKYLDNNDSEKSEKSECEKI